MSRFMAVTTVKNEGPYVLEWVAHHRLCGFDPILVFQNDSEDYTVSSLRLLHRMGIIQYFVNRNSEGKYQTQAYRRASRTEAFRNAEWCMAIDFDEYIGVRTGSGRLEDLVDACPNADAIMLNWRNFGSSGKEAFDTELLTKSLTQTDSIERTKSGKHSGIKTLFRTSAFARPGIHLPRHPLKEDPVYVNGSGLEHGKFDQTAWRSADPKGHSLAQVNHYIIRDVASFILKSARGSANAPHRNVGKKYWSTYDVNESEDLLLADRSPEIWSEMERLDTLSNGLLMLYRRRAFRSWRKQFRQLMQIPDFRRLHSQIVRRQAAAA